MKVGELIEILNKYPMEADIRVLEKLRSYGGGHLAQIIKLSHSFNQDTGKLNVAIETDYEVHVVNRSNYGK